VWRRDPRIILDALSALREAPVDLDAYVSKAEGVLGALDLPKVAPEDGDTVYSSTSRKDWE
jgi:hypothetical protein